MQHSGYCCTKAFQSLSSTGEDCTSWSAHIGVPDLCYNTEAALRVVDCLLASILGPCLLGLPGCLSGIVSCEQRITQESLAMLVAAAPQVRSLHMF